MNKIMIPVGIGIILTIASLIWKRIRLKIWLHERRIDKRIKAPINTCGVCGAEMKKRVIRTGVNAGKEVMVCSKWPECRKVNWDDLKRIPNVTKDNQ